ncbi:hypothetical protein P7K49_012700 [Saguinus oedipus]|uniref:Uncharacterized protein n=1 Tax=Saguinus oedipus TaxID=9490 RepID=A0ABQ9VEQ2_SAGOE|nr:hypothetical protein P7K49_012700 [Saguinus oedipus]
MARTQPWGQEGKLQQPPPEQHAQESLALLAGEGGMEPSLADGMSLPLPCPVLAAAKQGLR